MNKRRYNQLRSFLKVLVFFILITSTSVFALSPACIKYSFLNRGFNFYDYQKCKHQIQQCPLEGLLAKQSCVDQVTKKHSSCDQWIALSKVLKMPITTISLRQIKNYVLVTVTYIADGQHHYYLLSQKGCMINTRIDPRDLDKKILRKYKKAKFMTTNWKEPTYKQTKNGSTYFLVMLRVTDTCLACRVIGFFTVSFKFDQTGLFLGASIGKVSKTGDG